jgi:plasmid replication initiation protein
MAKSPKLSLMARDAFAELPLHEKNAYLQEIAQRFAETQSREYVALDKEALSRLRRYYLRRVWADLRLNKSANGPLEQALESLASAIRLSAVEEDMKGALLQELPPKRVLRTPPQDDAQLMFFVPAIYDAPVKDDVNLMDVAPFSLSRKSRQGVIRYELKDSLITIEGGAESGLATVFDYDIFLNMVSYLAEEVRRYRQDDGKGLRPSLPAKVYRPSSAHILKFCRRSDGGKSYEDLEAALDRLTKTTIKVTNLANGKRREVDSRPLIGGYRVVSRTGTNKIDQIEITIPDWVYLSVVKADKALPLLTLNHDYFLISSGIGRFLYRLARKAAGKTEARYSVAELHKRSGSTQEQRFFARDIREFVIRTQAFPMPDYDLSLSDGQDGPVLKMKRREEGRGEDTEAPLLVQGA